MKLIIGLGNPGRDYSLTRHNIGYMVVDALAKEQHLKFKSNRRFKAMIAEALVENERCLFAKPQTFMNLSGHSVRAIVHWIKIDLKGILLIIDDIALPFGEIRIRAKGSDAGHKGSRSICECLGTMEFQRMRLGILGRKPIKDYSTYVLSTFTKKEQKMLPDLIQRAVSACRCWVEKGVDVAMNKYNGNAIGISEKQ